MNKESESEIIELIKLNDGINYDEYNFTKHAVDILKSIDWGKRFCGDDSVKNILEKLESLEIRKNMSKHDILKAKCILFEIRYAYAIYYAGLTAKYEYMTGVNNSSVDFILFTSQNSPNWLLELTSINDSKKVKEATTKIDDNTYSYISPNNDEEMLDIIRAQSAILSKVANKKEQPTKFPPLDDSTYRAIVIDMRAMNAGCGADPNDFHNIAYGSKAFLTTDDAKNIMYARNKSQEGGSFELVKGVFEVDYPDRRAKYLQERIHALIFISEKKYEEGEINSKMEIFFNPHLVSIDANLSFPLKIN